MIRLSNAECAHALLRGEIDVNHYWRKSGEQQVRSAGVLLTARQQERALKNLARLAGSLKQTGVSLTGTGAVVDEPGCHASGDDLRSDFDNYLATLR